MSDTESQYDSESESEMIEMIENIEDYEKRERERRRKGGTPYHK